MTVSFELFLPFTLNYFYMKKMGLCLGLMAVFMLSFSCKEKTMETIETNTTTVETDTVTVRDTVVTPKTDATSIKVDSNGVDINSKSTKVEVKK
jgi:hypothetical protein